MKILIFLLAIFLVIGSFTLNANSSVSSKTTKIYAPVDKLTGFKKDISVAD